ncbi:MAG: peptidoglycan editing factor PgeF [Steroidobacteraceae bacterium]
MSTALQLLTPDWPLPNNVRAVVTGREGGVSTGRYASLNLGMHVGDEPAAVASNRMRLLEQLGSGVRPVWLQQVHGRRVVTLTSRTDTVEADAAVSFESGLACTIMVADCLPVLFATRDGRAVGAAHAGWRGLAAGVIEATVDAMRADPSQLLAWLGPCISVAHFEVGEEVRAAFVGRDAAAATAFVRNARGRWQCDLASLARQRLAGLGILSTGDAGLCNYSLAARFYSHRREQPTGRFAALIWRTD